MFLLLETRAPEATPHGFLPLNNRTMNLKKALQACWNSSLIASRLILIQAGLSCRLKHCFILQTKVVASGHAYGPDMLKLASACCEFPAKPAAVQV